MERGLLAVLVGAAAACAADPPQLPEGSSTAAATSSSSTGPPTVDPTTTTTRGMDADTTSLSTGSSTDTVDGSTSDASSSGGPGSTGGGLGDPACFPEGPYGTCTDHADCECVSVGGMYQACTQACRSVADCPVPAARGINVGCVAVGFDKTCVLSCDPDLGCPCGLTCTMVTPRTHFCTEAVQ